MAPVGTGGHLLCGCAQAHCSDNPTNIFLSSGFFMAVPCGSAVVGPSTFMNLFMTVYQRSCVFMARPWHCPGTAICDCREVAKLPKYELPWHCHGNTIGLPCICHGQCYGTGVKLPWSLMELRGTCSTAVQEPLGALLSGTPWTSMESWHFPSTSRHLMLEWTIDEVSIIFLVLNDLRYYALILSAGKTIIGYS